MHISGSKEIVNTISQGLCSGCGACVSLCPYFKTHKGKTVMLFQCSREQGRCHAFCPRSEVDLDFISEKIFGEQYSAEPLGKFEYIAKAKQGAEAGLKKFQTGGTVTSLIKFALKEGYIDSAILTEGNGAYAMPVIVTDYNNVEKYSGSKYSASPTVMVFNEAANNGFKKTGFVGTPCQVTAIAQMKSNPLEREDFENTAELVIGLFCTWSLIPDKFESMLKSQGGIDRIKKFDIPPPPADVMLIEDDKGERKISLSDIRNITQNSCAYCHDMTAEFADISVGVYEGALRENIIIVRTAKGAEFIQKAVEKNYLETSELPEEAVAALKAASIKKRKRAFEKGLAEGKINSEESLSMLRVRSSFVDEIIKGV